MVVSPTPRRDGGLEGRFDCAGGWGLGGWAGGLGWRVGVSGEALRVGGLERAG